MYYKLIRDMPDGKAVPGKLYWTSHYFNHRTQEYCEVKHFICSTLENADYLIPALIYRVAVTRSPKFQRLLPILLQVPGRSGIRLHRGTKPAHSRGCILVSPAMEPLLTARFLAEQSAREDCLLEICNS